MVVIILVQTICASDYKDDKYKTNGNCAFTNIGYIYHYWV